MYSFKEEILRDLPGVFVEVNSVKKKLYDDSQFGTTDAVLCIGTAFDGPNGVPVPIYDPTYATYTYGDTYDRETKREVDLTATLADAYNSGCRTLYGFRIGGSEAQKDFRLRSSDSLRLRVKSRFPSNKAKHVYFNFDNTSGQEVLTIYKPITKATATERYNALVDDDQEMIKIDINLGLNGQGFNADTPLSEVIRYINKHTLNNVITLSIVNKKGQDVTLHNESYDLALGSLFPGVYFLGRKRSLVPCRTEVRTHVIKDKKSPKPFSSFSGKYFHTLRVNTDVNSEYPIYSTTDKDLNEAFTTVGLKIYEHNDYLMTPGATALAFEEDDIDYEDTNMTSFQKYMKLGSGYAITATAFPRTNSHGQYLTPRVKESDPKDKQYVVGIGEGAYSVLQNADMPYRVLGAQICADTVISGRLPKPKDFLKAFPIDLAMVNTVVSGATQHDTEIFKVTPVIDTKDVKHSPRKYKFSFAKVENADEIVDSAIYQNEVFTVIPSVANEAALKLDENTYKVGQMFYLEDVKKVKSVTFNNKLQDAVSPHQKFKHFVTNDKIIESEVTGSEVTFKEVTALTDLKYDTATNGLLTDSDATAATYYATTAAAQAAAATNAKYVLLSVNDVLYVAKYDAGALTPIGQYDILIDKSSRDDRVLAYVESFDHVENRVIISVTDFNYRTVAEFLSDLKDNKDFSGVFKCELTDTGIVEKDALIEEVLTPVLVSGKVDLGTLAKDRSIDYDYTMRIPYRTPDNFARQFAQHCLYTELKTAHTHGVIGAERISDYTLSGVEQKFQDLKKLNLNLELKRANGRSVIDDDGMPVDIGRSISFAFFQNNVPVYNSTYAFVGNGAAAYAGMISALPVEQSPTNQKIGINPLFELTASQLSDLTRKGIVTVKNTFTRGYVVTDGCTMADPTDALSRLNSVRIIDAVERVIRRVCEPFIGKQNKTSVRNSIKTGLTSELNKLKGVLLYDFMFEIADNVEALQYTHIDINYTIMPFNEIRQINNFIQIKQPGTK